MSVTIRFCGATHTVTGSCYLFQTGSGRFLIDCGLFQGQKTLKEVYTPPPKCGGFRLRLEAGLIDPSGRFDQTTLKLSSGSSGF